MRRLARFLADAENVLLLLGLLLLGTGLWLVYPWLALAVVGGLLFCLAVAGPFMRRL